MVNKISKRHHYLPKCYLKGFTRNGKQLFIYDKKKDEVRPGNIENSFVLWKRNTVTFPNGRTSDFLENAYADIESDSAYLFPMIIDSAADHVPYDDLDKLKLALFISTLFWRVPSIDARIQGLIQNEGFKNRKFYLKYPDGWSDEDKQRMEKLLLDEPSFQKMYPMMLIFEPFLKENYSLFLEDWKFYYHDPGRFFAGDNPLITRVNTEPNMILNEFILPLASNRILIASKGKPLQVEREWTLYVNLQLLDQSERYVCSNDEDFLRAVVGLYKQEKLNPSPTNFKDVIFKVVT